MHFNSIKIYIKIKNVVEPSHNIVSSVYIDCGPKFCSFKVMCMMWHRWMSSECCRCIFVCRWQKSRRVRNTCVRWLCQRIGPISRRPLCPLPDYALHGNWEGFHRLRIDRLQWEINGQPSTRQHKHQVNLTNASSPLQHLHSLCIDNHIRLSANHQNWNLQIFQLIFNQMSVKGTESVKHRAHNEFC